jgi:hypothetical protein
LRPAVQGKQFVKCSKASTHPIQTAAHSRSTIVL